MDKEGPGLKIPAPALNDLTDTTAIITGAPRSGSSLTYRLLDDTPRIFNALTQVYFLEYLQPMASSAVEWFVGYFFDAPIDDLLEAIHERELLPLYREKTISKKSGVVVETRFEFEFDEKEFKTNLDIARKRFERTVQGVWRCWFSTLRRSVGAADTSRMVLIKSPDYGRSALGAERFFDDFRAVFVIRDPVLALSSFRRLRENQQSGRELTTLRMLGEIENHRFMFETIDSLSTRRPESVEIVRFEDLVEDPRAIMRSIAAFLCIPYHDAMSRPTILGQPWVGNSSFEPLDGISRRPRDRGQNLLSPEEMEMIAQCIGPFLARYGYADIAAPRSASAEMSGL